MFLRLARFVAGAAATAALLLGSPAITSAAPAKMVGVELKDGGKSKDTNTRPGSSKAKKGDDADAKKVAAAKKAAEAKKADDAKKVAAAKKAAEAKKADDAKKAAEAKKADDAKKAAEAKKVAAAKKADDAKKAAEAKKVAAAKKADDAKKVAGKDAPKKGRAGSKDDDGKDDLRSAAKGVKGAASIGAPNRGSLVRGVKLRSSRSLKVRAHAQAWGVPALVKLLQRAAGKVAKRHARSVLLIGDLSQKSGGALTGHNSHQSGRDADVGFYVANSKGKPVAMKRFVAFDGAGRSKDPEWAQFDDARNWALIEALLTDKDTNVHYIFVSNPLRTRVLAYAKSKKVAKDLYTQAAFALMSPRDADVHDDHFHVRIYCPDSMKGTCQEESHQRVANVVAKASKKGDSKADEDPYEGAAKSGEQ